MRGLPAISPKASLRTRRWDALVLGGATPGLVAAVLLGRSGARVLVVEEEAAARAYPGLREPFFITAAAADEVLGACLQALGVPLIDQRSIQAQPIAYQVVLPDARLDVGEAALTAEELVTWGFLEPEPGKKLVRALAAAGALQAKAMLAAPVVRGLRRRGIAALRPQAAALPESLRGAPDELADLPRSLAPYYEAQLRALSNLGASAPPPEARARLLGAAPAPLRPAPARGDPRIGDAARLELRDRDAARRVAGRGRRDPGAAHRAGRAHLPGGRDRSQDAGRAAAAAGGGIALTSDVKDSLFDSLLVSPRAISRDAWSDTKQRVSLKPESRWGVANRRAPHRRDNTDQ